MAYAGYEEEEVKLPKKININAWFKVLRYSFKYWPILIVLLLTLFGTSLYDSSFTPIMNRAAISAVEAFGSTPGINLADVDITINLIGFIFSVNFIQYVTILIVGLVLRSGLIYVSFYLTDYLNVKIMVDLRRDSFTQVQKLSFAYFDKNSSGWLIARMQNDTSKISDMISWGIIRVVWIAFDIVITLITMFSMDWKMSLVILASTPLVALLSPIFESWILNLSRIARAAYSSYVSWLAECISGAKTIKTLAIEDTTYDESNAIISDLARKTFKRARAQSFFQPSVNIIAALTNAAIIFFAYQLLPSTPGGAVDIALLAVFLGFVGAVYNPIQESAEILAEVMSTQASCEKILSLIESEPAIQDSPEVSAIYGTLLQPKVEQYPTVNGHIEFTNVDFSYLPGIEIIRNLNLTIKQGQTIAIVGETGSGKSTTVNLLCRFYEPTGGNILIDGVDYRERSVGWLRSNIGYVQQTPFIFTGTIKENIRYGKLNATDEEIIRAAKIVDLDDFVMGLPEQYDTKLSDGGSSLSVGQKQLISFARALIRDPKIMILDEATSSIDTETETTIQKAIKTVLAGRTSIIIAHRLSTIVDSDRILMMVDGKIIEDGSHQELMAKNGAYHRLYMNQFSELHIDEQIATYEKQIKKA
ncbi:MAG TPA: ABC transporter ATP-binding protein [Bacilli bacterium]|jgi:ATP-binding cassette subfamily B protein|nr:ABC transporter ATP-binding protein [Bacilli bacterium]MDD3389161.1 ABC transporter ATP-binding protein [Bacilli bacterium]MDD4344805.1 ABC transporter ATP-binding protein [Bacilli bacterium]MDD4520871.1 ABC transporter ATP-binding protein [Bacilli bacterium]HKM11034.1 ABC transporter ATP-binding protein [Bacilli bacterium]